MAFDLRSAGIGVTQRASLNHRTGDFHDDRQVWICGFGKPIMTSRPKREMSDYVAKYDRHGRARI